MATDSAYQVYSLTQAGAELTVVPERGGMITRWQVGGQELLYLDAARFSQPDLSVRGGIPILFPICGNLTDNTFYDNGQTYTLKQHGFARDQAWEVVNQTANSLTLHLHSNPTTLAQYPFEFCLEMVYRLDPQALHISTTLQNLGPTAMPFSLGFHPYFAVSDKNALSLDIPATEYIDQKTQATHPWSGTLDWHAPELDLAFRPLTRPQARIEFADRQQQLEFSFSPDYTTLVFWTLADKPYICLEPWTAPRQALNTGVDRLMVPVAGAWHGEFSLRIGELTATSLPLA